MFKIISATVIADFRNEDFVHEKIELLDDLLYELTDCNVYEVEEDVFEITFEYLGAAERFMKIASKKFEEIDKKEK